MRTSVSSSFLSLTLVACGARTGLFTTENPPIDDAATTDAKAFDAPPDALEETRPDALEETRTDAPIDTGPIDATVAPPPPDFAWYVLDETTGTTAHDSTPHHYDVPDLVGIEWGEGGNFDGVSVCGAVDVDPAFRNPPVTITAWLTPLRRTDSTVNEYGLTPFPPNAISGDVPDFGGYGVGLEVWSDGAPGAAACVETGVGTTLGFHAQPAPLTAGTETFVASVAVAASATLYINGVAIASFDADVPPSESPTPLHLGCHNDDFGYGSKRFYAGRMRDARVYTRALEATEIARLFAAGPTTKHP